MNQDQDLAHGHHFITSQLPADSIGGITLEHLARQGTGRQPELSGCKQPLDEIVNLNDVLIRIDRVEPDARTVKHQQDDVSDGTGSEAR